MDAHTIIALESQGANVTVRALQFLNCALAYHAVSAFELKSKTIGGAK